MGKGSKGAMGNQPAAPGIPQPRSAEPEAGAANEQAGDSNAAARPSSNMTYTIQNPLNLRKTSIDLVRREQAHCVEFEIDCDMDCVIEVYFLTLALPVQDDAAEAAPRFRGQDKHCIEGRRLQAGISQRFEQEEGEGLIVDEETLAGMKYDDSQPQNFPLVIVAKTEQGADLEPGMAHAQVTYCTFNSGSDGVWSVRPIRQHLMVGPSVFEVQELYGLQSDEPHPWGLQADGTRESQLVGLECLICMEQTRDTVVLPCRHLCMCATCAATFRLRTSNCPVCRQKVSALLQIQLDETSTRD